MNTNTAKNIAGWDDVLDHREELDEDAKYVLTASILRRMTEVDESTFTEWQNEVNSGFVGRNEFSLDGEIQGSDE
eukprot:464517-Ditylum_brightwellii.AAC.1